MCVLAYLKKGEMMTVKEMEWRTMILKRRMVMLTSRHDIRRLSFISSANPHSSAMRNYCFYPVSQMRNQSGLEKIIELPTVT